jgi:hypothetical protein
MSRYFFHVFCDGEVRADEKGQYFNDLKSAKARAATIARELAQDGYCVGFVCLYDKQGNEWDRVSISTPRDSESSQPPPDLHARSAILFGSIWRMPARRRKFVRGRKAFRGPGSGSWRDDVRRKVLSTFLGNDGVNLDLLPFAEPRTAWDNDTGNRTN